MPDNRAWRKGDLLKAKRFEDMRQHATNAGFMTVDEPLSIHRNLSGPHIAFDPSYGRARWGRIMVASDAVQSDNFCILHPCSTSSPSTAEITSDSSIKTYLTTPITEEWASDVFVATGEQHLYFPFGGDNQGLLINPATSGMFPPRSSSTNSDILIFTSTGWITGRQSDVSGYGRVRVSEASTPSYMEDVMSDDDIWIDVSKVNGKMKVSHIGPGPCSFTVGDGIIMGIEVDAKRHIRCIQVCGADGYDDGEWIDLT